MENFLEKLSKIYVFVYNSIMKSIPCHILSSTTIDLLEDRNEIEDYRFRHEQITIAQGDYTVDKNIHNLVCAVNAFGLITQFSCEGDSPLLI